MTVKCPYCVSEIVAEALVCPVCHRDLYLFKPLLDRLEAQEQRIAELETRFASVTADQAPGAALAAGAALVDMNPSLPPPAWPTPRQWLLWGLAPLMLLLLAHLLITVVYDLNTLYLRVASLLLPIPFGVWLTASGRRPGAVLALVPISLALLAVLGMSGVLAVVDGSPVWPQNLREWREMLEYAASIGFSHLTGILIGRMIWQRVQEIRLREAGRVLSDLVKNGGERTEKLQGALTRFNDLAGAVTAAATTVISVYTGLQGVIGK